MRGPQTRLSTCSSPASSFQLSQSQLLDSSSDDSPPEGESDSSTNPGRRISFRCGPGILCVFQNLDHSLTNLYFITYLLKVQSSFSESVFRIRAFLRFQNPAVFFIILSFAACHGGIKVIEGAWVR
jgi:hypothetical protein